MELLLSKPLHTTYKNKQRTKPGGFVGGDVRLGPVIQDCQNHDLAQGSPQPPTENTSWRLSYSVDCMFILGLISPLLLILAARDYHFKIISVILSMLFLQTPLPCPPWIHPQFKLAPVFPLQCMHICKPNNLWRISLYCLGWHKHNYKDFLSPSAQDEGSSNFRNLRGSWVLSEQYRKACVSSRIIQTLLGSLDDLSCFSF